MTIFWLKIIACITMILDHIKFAIPNFSNEATIYLGRIAFPLFAFCAVEGFVHTSDLNKYIKRIAISGIISQIPFMLFRSLPSINDFWHVNVMVTILLGFLAIYLYNKLENKFIAVLTVIGTCFIGQFLQVDYKFYGVLTIFLLYIFRNSKLKKSVLFIILTILYYFIRVKGELSLHIWKLIICVSISVIFMCLYNGKRGTKNQKFYYWFYPVHLLVLYLISPYNAIFKIL